MLKGTTKIELTDVKSRKKQIFEKHNLVTNAVPNLFQPTLGNLTNEETLQSNIPAYPTFFGGLLLFDTALTENVNTLYPPSGASMVGCARYNSTNTGAGVYRGSYNPVESEYNAANRSMKYVYDFTTSQANGTIASVCLTSDDAGYGAYGSGETVSNTDLAKSVFLDSRSMLRGSLDRGSGISIGGSNEALFLIDAENDIAYYITFTDTSHGKITKRTAGLKHYSVFSNNKPLIENVDLSVLTTPLSTYNSYNFDLSDNALYIVSSASSSLSNNGTFTVTKIAFMNFAITQYTVTNITGNILHLQNGCSLVHRGNVYMRSTTSGYKAIKINITNSVDYNILGEMASYSPVPCFAINGKIYWQFSEHYISVSHQEHYSLYVSDDTTNSIHKSVFYRLRGIDYGETSTRPAILSYTPVLAHQMFFYQSCQSSNRKFVYISDYLATINNLPTPITKSSAQTMKITYTIQEVDDE